MNSFNEAAGQSVFHVHIHLIPRYKGDVENPKGGVRGNSKQAEILILFYR
ncbi:HIT family protein [Phocaeicola dorei]|nr:HIT domain-containing protein [Phocaeicola dorei]UWN84737.1 HIT domain-containing protein [Phocaeicola dorei]